MQRAIERVRGFHDVDAAAHRRRNRVLSALSRTYRFAGFDMVDVPVLEHMDLYVRKSGSQVLSKLYAFQDQGRRDVALRPEFTASVIRSLAPVVGSASDKIRVAYEGPVFRYEKPQRATLRQFTQSGVELLGESGPDADAEMVALACNAAQAAGVVGIRLVIGHLGPLKSLLAHLHVDANAETFLLEHLEYYGRGAEQQQYVRGRLGLADESPDIRDADDSLPEAWTSALEGLSPAAAREVVMGLLAQMGVDLSGNTRTPDEIVERVLYKVQRQTAMRSGVYRQNMERALEFCAALASIRGAPARVLDEARALLRSYGAPDTALADLRQVIHSLEAHDLGAATVTVAPGMARGIAYYSGLIFELYSDAAAHAEGQKIELQLCGGGRYDSLPQALTGRYSFPALGFAFGVERLMNAVSADTSMAREAPRVCVCAEGNEAYRVAVQLTEMFRTSGLITVMQRVDTRGPRQIEKCIRDGSGIVVLLWAGHDARDLDIQVAAAPEFAQDVALEGVHRIVADFNAAPHRPVAEVANPGTITQ